MLKNTGQNPNIIVCAGSNNVGLDSPAGLVTRLEQLGRVILTVRPHANLAFVGLFPRRTKSKQEHQFLIKVYALLQEMCSVKNFKFVKMGNVLVNDKRCTARDGIHLSKFGKEVLSNKLADVFSSVPNELENY